MDSTTALSNPPPRSVRNTSTSVRGKSSVANAAMTRSAARPVSAPWPAMPLFARSMSGHAYAHLPPTRTYVRSLAEVGARPVAVELAVEDVREPGLVGPRLCGSDVCARTRPPCPAVS